MLQVIDSFLTEEECDLIIEMIDANNMPSSVSGEGSERSVQSKEHRTSSTCNLPKDNEVVSRLKQKIADTNGFPVEMGEDIQGQKYEPGQYFKPHYDFFENDSYTNHCLASGNRTKTVMIYLNDDFEGGGTNFPEIDRHIKPKKGSAVVWDNMKGEELQRDMLHEGVEVKSGTKYIVTSWWRENVWNPGLDDKLARDHHKNKIVKIRPINGKTFSTWEEIPRFSEKGYDVVKLPDDAWNLVMEMYEELKEAEAEEHFPGKDSIIRSAHEGASSTLMDLGLVHEKRDLLHQMLRPMHEQFCGVNLEPTFIYGIRSYLRGAGLVKHRDRIETHHISSIIIVDKDLRCGCKTKPYSDDWPLDIQGHNGIWQKIYAEPGDMILYESATCEHGREELFGGTHFRNMFVHYKLKDWHYEPR
jgi:prolyl 4-hydroxylase